MAYITTSYGRPIQGVSQQPDRIRQEGQCTLQENFIPDVVKGLTKRPSTYFVRSLFDRSLSTLCKFHAYDRGDESYFMCIEPDSDSISVFNERGEPQVVNGSAAYLSHSEPLTNFDMRTIGDFTFITNKTKPVVMSAERSPIPANVGIVYCQYATYGKTYKVILDGNTLASYTTPDGSDPSHINSVATDYIISLLAGQINGQTTESYGENRPVVSQDTNLRVVKLTYDALSITSVKKGGSDIQYYVIDSRTLNVPLAVLGDTLQVVYTKAVTPSNSYTAEVHNNVMVIRKNDGADFKLDTSDSQKGEDLVAAKGSVKSVNQLPPYAPDGFVVRISGEGKSTKDDYWLKAVPTNDSKIKWVESVEPDIPISFDAATMPHVLIRDSISNGVATFTLKQADWDKREVGGEDSNPLPSFIDTDNPLPIKATGVFQNRLFFLSGESWIASRSNLFFNFWRESTQAEVDTDPIDGFADTDRVNNLYQYQILNGSLALFADQAQFVIDGSKPVTKANLTLQQVTAYPNNVAVQPQAGGENVFFAFDASGYTGVRELFTDNYTDTKKAFPITDYVSKYIAGKCNQLLASPNFNTLLVRTSESPSVIYVYDYLWQAEQKVQSAWHKWIFDGELLYLFFLEEKLYIVYRKGGKTHLDYLHMLNDPQDDGLDYSIKLDHKITATAVYNPDDEAYVVNLPYSYDDVVIAVGIGGFDTLAGSATVATNQGNGIWHIKDRVSENYQQLSVVCGTKYLSRYIPTQPVVKDFRDRVIGLDSIIMGNMYIHYEQTGFIEVLVKPKGGTERSYKFYGRYLGSAANLVGSPKLENDTYRAPIRQRAEDLQIILQADSHYPITIRDLEIDGTFHQRGQRI